MPPSGPRPICASRSRSCSRRFSSMFIADASRVKVDAIAPLVEVLGHGALALDDQRAGENVAPRHLPLDLAVTAYARDRQLAVRQVVVAGAIDAEAGGPIDLARPLDAEQRQVDGAH